MKTLVSEMKDAIPASLDAIATNETAQLITALRAPKTRGNWGELQLKRCVEYAGMVQYCSFSEQVTARDEDDKMLRPDMTIQLPNGREIVVDAKTPLDAFLDASGATRPGRANAAFCGSCAAREGASERVIGQSLLEAIRKGSGFCCLLFAQ